MRATWLILLTAFLCCAAQAAENVAVGASREGDAIRVTARAVLRAAQPVIWETLTDYEHLPRFVPGMRSSRIVGRTGEAVLVAQAGEARLLLFSYPIDVTVASVPHPPHEIQVHLVGGNLRQLDGGYRIEPLADGRMALHWTGLIRPALDLPPLVGEYLMRAAVEDQFLGVVREIERREAGGADR